MEIKQKCCNTCQRELSLDKFSKAANSPDGLYYSCKECAFKKNKEWCLKNKQRIIEQKKQYNLAHKEEMYERSMKYFRAHPGIRTKYRRKMVQNNQLFRLKCAIRGLVKSAFVRKGYKKTTKTCKILGCDFPELKKHLESQFEPWMNWENYGKFNGQRNFGFDIDHIVPLVTAKNEEEVVKLCHYTNLQPLCSYVNRVLKRGKIGYVPASNE